MSHQTVNELSDNINKIVAATVVNDKQGLITILKKNGLVVSATTSDADLIGVTYLGAARSQRLRNDLVAYWSSQLNFTDDVSPEKDFFEANGKVKVPKVKTLNPSKVSAGGSGTQVGNVLRGLFTKENVNAGLNTGLQVLGAKLTAKADSATINAATQNEVAKTQRLIEEQKGGGDNKWVLPVVIGVGVAIIGLVIYLKKK